MVGGEGVLAVAAGLVSAMSLLSRSSTVTASGTFNSPAEVRFRGAMIIVGFRGDSV